ncbi:MAG TPA: hypothetical protein PK357_01435 [Candidatus Pacearchaeota archaeon]|nr:hypothetical protein [Candidatus Pacearchaeota archaeon]
MGLFGKKKVIDYTEGYSSRKTRPSSSSEVQEPSNNSSSQGSFFEMSETSGEGTVGEYYQRKQTQENFDSLDAEEKRRRLARRLKNMTDKMEDLSNTIYLLQQRVEVLEKKINVNNYNSDYSDEI